MTTFQWGKCECLAMERNATTYNVAVRVEGVAPRTTRRHQVEMRTRNGSKLLSMVMWVERGQGFMNL